jgi:hypothetical protein
MTDSSSEFRTVWMASQEPWRNIRGFYFAVATYIPYPDNVATLARLLAGPFPAVHELTSKALVLASKGKDDELRELFDDLRYRPWVHMPWVKEEIE